MKKNENESFEDYKERRKMGNVELRGKLKFGNLVHESSKYVGTMENGEHNFVKSTYRKPV